MSPLAVLFDLDGVISDTASVHKRAWKVVFDKFLRTQKGCHVPFVAPDDYLRYLDGKARLTGIEDFLRSRSIDLPYGEVDALKIDCVHGIANAKNVIFRELLDISGLVIFGDALRQIEALMASAADIGLASSSKNARLVLDKAGLTGCFKSIMDGIVAEEKGIASKPHPAFYHYAADMLGRSTKQCIVFEDAISGVVSAKQAGVGLVVGISRNGDSRVLRTGGADIVVSSLDELDFGRAGGSLSCPELFLRNMEGLT